MSSSEFVLKIPAFHESVPAAAADCPRSPASTVCAMTWRKLGGSPARLDGSRHGRNGSEHSISLAVGARLFVEYARYPVAPDVSLYVAPKAGLKCVKRLLPLKAVPRRSER